MKKIKIVKLDECSSGSYDYDYQSIAKLVSDETEWTFVSDEKLKELKDVIAYANTFRWQLKNNFLLVLVEDVPLKGIEDYLKDIYESFQQKERKEKAEKEKREKAALARAEARKKAELKKKKAQLEKLKQELGES